MAESEKVANVAFTVFLVLSMWAGSILLWYGIDRMYRLDPAQALNDKMENDPIIKQMLDCDRLSFLPPTPPASTNSPVISTRASLGPILNDLATAPTNASRVGVNLLRGDSSYQKYAARRCRRDQAPYVWFPVLTGIIAFITSVVALFAVTKEERYPLYLFALWAALAMAMLFTSIFVVLVHAGVGEAKLVDCRKLPKEIVETLPAAGMYCAESRTGSSLLHYWRCFWAGELLLLLPLLLMSFLLAFSYRRSKVLVVLPQDPARPTVI